MPMLNCFQCGRQRNLRDFIDVCKDCRRRAAVKQKDPAVKLRMLRGHN